MAVIELLTPFAVHPHCIMSICSASYFLFEGETLVCFATTLCHCLPFYSSSTVLEQCPWIERALSFVHAYCVILCVFFFVLCVFDLNFLTCLLQFLQTKHSLL